MKKETLDAIKSKLEQNPNLKTKLEAAIKELTNGKEISEAEAKEILEKNPALAKKLKDLNTELTEGLELTLEELQQINGGFLTIGVCSTVFGVFASLGGAAVAGCTIADAIRYKKFAKEYNKEIAEANRENEMMKKNNIDCIGTDGTW